MACRTSGTTDPLRGFNFNLELGGITKGGCRECSGHQESNAPVEYREGSDKPTHVRKLTGLTKYADITLKKGIIVDEHNEIWNWLDTVVQGKTERKNCSIILEDETGTKKLQWDLLEAWPSSYSGPGLNATTNDVAVETLVISCEEVKKGG
jgi:phage tail-like protein